MENVYYEAFDVTEVDWRSTKVTQGQNMENVYYEAFDVTEVDWRSPKVTKVIQGQSTENVMRVTLQKITKGHRRSSKVTQGQSTENVMRVTLQKITKGHPRSSKVTQGQSQENVYYEECDVTENDQRSPQVNQGAQGD